VSRNVLNRPTAREGGENKSLKSCCGKACEKRNSFRPMKERENGFSWTKKTRKRSGMGKIIPVRDEVASGEVEVHSPDGRINNVRNH